MMSRRVLLPPPYSPSTLTPQEASASIRLVSGPAAERSAAWFYLLSVWNASAPNVRL